LLSAEP